LEWEGVVAEAKLFPVSYSTQILPEMNLHVICNKLAVGCLKGTSADYLLRKSTHDNMLSFAEVQQRVSKNSECFLMALMFVILKPLKLIRVTKVANTADKNIYYPAPCTESIMMIHCAQSSYMWPLFSWHHRIVRVKNLCFLLFFSETWLGTNY
jgi:hypothetical protein